MKIGVLGGTFNPIHNGHLLIAEHIRDYFKLDRIYFIPTNIPPHKDYTREISDEDRLELVELSIESNPYFFLSDMELKRGGVSYTIDTITELYKELKVEDKIYLIVGGDLLNDISSWKRYKDLINRVYLVVVNREEEKAENYIAELPFIKEVKSVPFSVTSTGIRKRIKEGKSIKYLVCEKAEAYIHSKNLYQSVIQ